MHGVFTFVLSNGGCQPGTALAFTEKAPIVQTRILNGIIGKIFATNKAEKAGYTRQKVAITRQSHGA
ncbi:hypothetical protein C4F51_04385 [Cellvibrio sp. KB43]|uniref:Uncharacterized protein n=1 Tax=Cellvibrio polysaccharolyticus TaxID=2082724 RepID=A0A928V3V2_9GAMM|nr:hypothetical protein [Cellvibrio polysaccharolyticus]